METHTGLWEIFAIVGAVHGFFLAIVLWSMPRGNRTANRLLAPLVALYSTHLLHIALYWTGGLEAVVHFWGTAWLLPYLYGPLLYLYARALTERRFRLEPRQLLHALPFALGFGIFSRFYLLDPTVEREGHDPSICRRRPGARGDPPGARALLSRADERAVHWDVVGSP